MPGRIRADEMMTIAAARELRDERRLLRRHRPAERGGQSRAPHACAGHRADLRIRARSARSRTCCRSRSATASWPRPPTPWFRSRRSFAYWLQGGRIDVGFLGAAQIDRFANLNTTVVGDYRSPKVRLPGAGGAAEIACSAREVLIMLRQSKRAFVAKLDFVTSAGYLDGGDSRDKLGHARPRPERGDNRPRNSHARSGDQGAYAHQPASRSHGRAGDRGHWMAAQGCG